MVQLQFDKKVTEEIGKGISKLKLTPELSKNLDDFAQLYANFLPLSKIVMRGFLLLTLEDLQKKANIVAADLVKKDLPRRQEILNQMMDILYEKLSRTLIRADQKPQLQAAIQEAWKLASRY